MKHALGRDSVHYTWDPAIAPRLRVKSGDILAVETRDSSDGRIGRNRNPPKNFHFAGHPLAGPILIEGAQPGAAIVVEMLELQPGDWGHTIVRPGLGLLGDQVAGRYVHRWRLSPDGWAYFSEDVRLRTAPFLGIVGLAPETISSTIPPHSGGGNLDFNELVAGARLWLPVKVAGGLLSMGDGHAAQGYGEVCGTAIETTMRAQVRLTLEDRRLDMPAFTSPRRDVGESAGFIAIGDTFEAAARLSLAAMVEALRGELELSFEAAYALASVACDLRVAEVSNGGKLAVAAALKVEVEGIDLFSRYRRPGL